MTKLNKQLLLVKVNRWAWRFVDKHASIRNVLSKALPSLADKLKDTFVPPGDGIICLPDDRLIEIGEKVQFQEDIALPLEVIDHFIDQSSYRAIMNFCLCRDANGCKDYPIDLGCLFIGEAARGIHPDLHRSATKEESREHVRLGREAGMVNIVGRAKFDSVVLDATPHNKLMTICCCCPCCCITRALPFVPPEISDFFQRMPGVSVHVNDSCTGCGECIDVCIYRGIKIDGETAEHTDSCRACGRCVQTCPNDSIEISVDDDTYVQQAIEMLSRHVDVT